MSLSLSWRSLPRFLLVLAIVAYASFFSTLTLTRYAAFEARALDLGNLHQTVWNTAQGRLFQMSNQPGTSGAPGARLSLHVEPILLPIAVLYWLYDGPETLLILQSVVVALGALPLFALARWKLQQEWLALGFALAFLLNPSIQGANWLEFHPVTLAPTFLMAAFYFLVVGRMGWYACFALLAASCKEEMGLLLLMMGGYALLWLRRYRVGLITILLGAGWSLGAVLVVQQLFADGNIHWGRYDYLGETPLQKVMALLTQPGLVGAQLERAQSWLYLRDLLQPVGFLALLAPEVFLLALPSLAINLLADFPPMHQVYTLIYVAPLVPFVFLASIMGTARLQQALAHWQPWLRVPTTWLCLIILLAGALSAQRVGGYLPGGANYRLFTVTDHHRQAASIMAQIPPEAKVSAQDRLDPHVAGRETIYIFPRIDDADTVFVDVTGPAWPQHPNDLYTSVQDLLQRGFGIAAAADGYLLLRQGASLTEPPAAFYSAFRRPAHQPLATPLPTFGDQLQLVDYQVVTDAQGELVVQLYWQALQPLTADYRFYLAYQASDGALLYDNQFYQPIATLWYPTSKWQPGETVLVQSLPWTLDTDQFVLQLGVYQGEEGWTTGQRLPLTSAPMPTLPAFEQQTVVRLGGYHWRSTVWGTGQWVSIEPTTDEPTQPLAITIGDQLLQLRGVSVVEQPRPDGGPLTFTLDWQAGEQPIPFDYALSAQLFDSAGNKVAQHDWQPTDAIGLRPMTTWLPGERLQDTQTLLVPPMATGTYRVLLSIYNWQTGERLPVVGEATAAGSTIVLATLALP
ncbi:MAG: DUF2079 domain-containing protein [Caldilineaceae bacterium]|nr:DUF2079 domain-containing protein [Caldilineaceae bacterium]